MPVAATLLIAAVACVPKRGPSPGTEPLLEATGVWTVESRVALPEAYSSRRSTEITERIMDALVGHPVFVKRFTLLDGSRDLALERVIEEFEVEREFAALARMAVLWPSSRDPSQRLASTSNADVIIVVTVSELAERLGPSGLEFSLSLRVFMVEGQSLAPVAASSGSAAERIQFTDDNSAGQLPRELRSQLIAQALPSLVTAAAHQAFDELFAQLD